MGHINYLIFQVFILIEMKEGLINYPILPIFIL